MEQLILHANIIGEGEPVLILHGFLGMGDNWKTLANRLAEDGFQVHLIDQRNHGRSFHSDEFNYDIMVQDLKNYIDFHNLDKVTILGHSMGGKTTMLFAVTYPDIIKKIIIADISPKQYAGHHHEILKGLNAVNFEIQNTRKLVDEKLSEFVKEVGVRQFLGKNLYWIDKGQLGFRFNLKSLTKNYEAVLQGLPTQSVFGGETLFLSGANSKYITQDDMPILKAHFPKSAVKTVANSGHWLHAENPKDFYKYVIEFLKF